MKRIILLLSLSLLFVYCERDQFVNYSEIPGWLRDRIIHDERIIASSPASFLTIGAWIRYRYDGKFYFEYVNLTSSAFPQVYDFEGNAVNNIEFYNVFCRYRCCKQYVWKGSDYSEID